MIDVTAVQQWRVQRIQNGPFHTMVTACPADSHNRSTAITHRRLHIAEVQIDVSCRTDGNQLRDTLHRILQHVVSLAQRILERHPRVTIHVAQLLVVHDEHRVHIPAQLVHAFQGLHYLTPVLEIKRNGHHANRQQSTLLSHPRHHGSSTSTRAATHRRRHKHHLRLRVYQLLNHVQTALRLFAALLRITACTKTFAQLQLHGHWRVFQRRAIRVTHRKSHTLNTLVIHSAHGITSAATHANHLDDILHFVLDGSHKI